MDKDMLLSSFNVKRIVRSVRYTLGGEVSYSQPRIAYIRQGRAEFLYNGRVISAEEGDLVFIPMHARYYSVWYGEPQIEFYVLEFSFYASHLFHDCIFQTVKGISAEKFDEIYEESKKGGFLALSGFYNVIDRLQNILKKDARNFRHSHIQPALEYIENNFSQPVEIKALARLCNCSESSLFKTFQAIMGVSPIAYKHNIMIQNALDMLAHTDLSIEEISRRVGFASANYFRKIFIRITGKTPKEIRRKN